MTDLGKTQKRCPNGHVMEPDWDVCPYCQGEREAGGGGDKSELARTVRMEPTRSEPSPPASGSARKTQILDQPIEIDAVGWLVGASGASRGKMHRLEKDKSTVGADRGCEVVIDDASVTDRHASVRYQDGSFFVTDLDSTNGTFVNGQRIQREEISDGDRVRLGRSEWIFKCVVFDEAAEEKQG